MRVLYLQHNRIACIEGLDNLVELAYLALNDNLIPFIKNLKSLAKLAGLNLAANRLESI